MKTYVDAAMVPSIGDTVFVCEESRFLKSRAVAGHVGTVEKICRGEYIIRYEVPDNLKKFFRNGTTSEAVRIDKLGVIDNA